MFFKIKLSGWKMTSSLWWVRTYLPYARHKLAGSSSKWGFPARLTLSIPWYCFSGKFLSVTLTVERPWTQLPFSSDKAWYSLSYSSWAWAKKWDVLSAERFLEAKPLVEIRKVSLPVAGLWTGQCDVSLGLWTVVRGQPVYVHWWGPEQKKWSKFGKDGERRTHGVCCFLPS